MKTCRLKTSTQNILEIKYMRKYGLLLLGVVSIMLLFGCGAKDEPAIDFEKLGIDTSDGPTAVFIAEKQDGECREYDVDLLIIVIVL